MSRVIRNKIFIFTESNQATLQTKLKDAGYKSRKVGRVRLGLEELSNFGFLASRCNEIAAVIYDDSYDNERIRLISDKFKNRITKERIHSLKDFDCSKLPSLAVNAEAA